MLNAQPPSSLSPLRVDGIFGPKTLARVKEFQKNNGLKVDGVVGPKTWAKLRARQPVVPPRTGVLCGNGDPANRGRALGIRNAFRSSFAGQGGSPQLAGFAGPPAVAKIANPFRRLTDAQIATAQGVYGSSIDFSSVFISDQTGAGDLPFTVAIPGTLWIPTVQIINCGTFAPSDPTLIHELAHVWQSQHHSNPTQFMLNSVASQAAALSQNGAAALLDSSVRTNFGFPARFPFSAYAYKRGKPFGEYAAEQIAKQVEFAERVIIAKVASVPAGAADGDNATSLTTPRTEDRRRPGVIV